MLIVAEQKAREARLAIAFRHGAAEATGYADQSFDVVTASLLFHETPPAIAQAILREGFRLLQPGGQVLISRRLPVSLTGGRLAHRYF